MLPTHTVYSSQTRVGDQLIICQPHELETHLAAWRRDAGSLEHSERYGVRNPG